MIATDLETNALDLEKISVVLEKISRVLEVDVSSLCYVAQSREPWA
jgi:hypothetical protein